MSVLHLNQIKARVQDLFYDIIDLNGIGSTDKEKENKILTRCLAAYAIYNSTGCSKQDAVDATACEGELIIANGGEPESIVHIVPVEPMRPDYPLDFMK